MIQRPLLFEVTTLLSSGLQRPSFVQPKRNPYSMLFAEVDTVTCSTCSTTRKQPLTKSPSPRTTTMLIRVGCEIEFTYPNPTPVTLMLYLHPSIAARARTPERLEVDPAVPI